MGDQSKRKFSLSSWVWSINQWKSMLLIWLIINFELLTCSNTIMINILTHNLSNLSYIIERKIDYIFNCFDLASTERTVTDGTDWAGEIFLPSLSLAAIWWLGSGHENVGPAKYQPPAAAAILRIDWSAPSWRHWMVLMTTVIFNWWQAKYWNTKNKTQLWMSLSIILFI